MRALSFQLQKFRIWKMPKFTTGCTLQITKHQGSSSMCNVISTISLHDLSHIIQINISLNCDFLMLLVLIVYCFASHACLAFTMEQDIPDYDMDSEDELWIKSQSKKLELTPLKVNLPFSVLNFHVVM